MLWMGKSTISTGPFSMSQTVNVYQRVNQLIFMVIRRSRSIVWGHKPTDIWLWHLISTISYGKIIMGSHQLFRLGHGFNVANCECLPDCKPYPTINQRSHHCNTIHHHPLWKNHPNLFPGPGGSSRTTGTLHLRIPALAKVPPISLGKTGENIGGNQFDQLVGFLRTISPSL